ncbi:MAG: hypothetical protein BGO68_01145 [Candidatus Amoebophilus sp. 36-38]|nr:MAG: hypothetical protein BGO68_01145 [Candidatus Amoebophilus sp. 36-38]
MLTYIGCSGWFYKDWKNIFYPEDLPVHNYFPFYTTYLNTVEINSSFYHFPRDKTVELWRKKAPPNFKFSFKVGREITHIKKMKHVQEVILKFYRFHDLLQDNLGCFLFQFPPSFKFTKYNLELILSQLDPCYKNVLEFRHSSWWTPEVINSIQEKNIIFCTVSGFGLPENLIVTNGMTYLRFHGKPTYVGCYTEQELSKWAARVKRLGLKELYAYFNNTMAAHAVENASLFRRLLQDNTVGELDE